MATITFDTHKLIRTLQKAGFDPEQAEAVSEALSQALNESTALTLASKADIQRLEMKLLEHDGEFKLIKWMLGILLGGVLSLLLKAFF